MIFRDWSSSVSRICWHCNWKGSTLTTPPCTESNWMTGNLIPFLMTYRLSICWKYYKNEWEVTANDTSTDKDKKTQTQRQRQRCIALIFWDKFTSCQKIGSTDLYIHCRYTTFWQHLVWSHSWAILWETKMSHGLLSCYFERMTLHDMVLHCKTSLNRNYQYNIILIIFWLSARLQ